MASYLLHQAVRSLLGAKPQSVWLFTNAANQIKGKYLLKTAAGNGATTYLLCIRDLEWKERNIIAYLFRRIPTGHLECFIPTTFLERGNSWTLEYFIVLIGNSSFLLLLLLLPSFPSFLIYKASLSISRTPLTPSIQSLNNIYLAPAICTV